MHPTLRSNISLPVSAMTSLASIAVASPSTANRPVNSDGTEHSAPLSPVAILSQLPTWGGKRNTGRPREVAS